MVNWQTMKLMKIIEKSRSGSASRLMRIQDPGPDPRYHACRFTSYCIIFSFSQKFKYVKQVEWLFRYLKDPGLQDLCLPGYGDGPAAELLVEGLVRLVQVHAPHRRELLNVQHVLGKSSRQKQNCEYRS